MKSRNLPRFRQPEYGPAVACASCNAFRAECTASLGIDLKMTPLCWYCAHHIVEHKAAPGEEAMNGRCECLPWEILPRSSFKNSKGQPTAEAFEQRRDEVLERRASPLPRQRRERHSLS